MKPLLRISWVYHTLTVVAFCFLLLGLTGCASSLTPSPPSPPTPQAIRDSLVASYHLEHGTDLTGNVTAIQVATGGYILVEEQCGKFFSAVYRWTNDTGFNRKEIQLSGAAAAGILAATGASASAIAIPAILITMIGDSFDNFQNFALFTPKPDSVGKLVNDALATYKQSAPPNDPSIMTDVITAQKYVSGYADLCTYHRIQEFINQAVAKAIPVDSNKNPPSIFSSDDQLQLAGVNAALGLPITLLSDSKYVELSWYLKEAYLNDTNRTKVLNDFSTIQSSMWDPLKKTLPPQAQLAARILATIAQKNSALVDAEKALQAANKPALPGPGALGFPSGGIVIPSPSPSYQTMPKIVIQ